MDLLEVNKYGVLVDVCPSCGGIWLTLVERCQKKEMVDCNKAPSALLQLARLYEQRGDEKVGYEKAIRMLKD